jgi:hypothetical protein
MSINDEVVSNRRKIENITGNIGDILGTTNQDRPQRTDEETLEYPEQSIEATTDATIEVTLDGNLKDGVTLPQKLVTKIGRTIHTDILDINSTYNATIDRIELGYEQQSGSSRDVTSLADSQHTIDVTAQSTGTNIAFTNSIEIT